MDVVDVQDIKNRFDLYLKISGDRIIFSGIFGIGKTTFLKEFFDQHDSYNAIHLYPVNYSVASNKDIFELIKYDIFYELLKLDVEYEKIDFSNNILLTYFIKNRLVETFSALIRAFPKIGKPTSNVINSLAKLYDDFKIYKDETDLDELEKVKNFLDDIQNTKGSIYEFDLYSELIENLLIQLNRISNKSNILIIDDLERVDPDHIFRLLNIFAAHVNNVDSDNKFGFDKVIFVLDIQNTKNIFHHKFGLSTNFEGYIDKFYSRDVFEFDNREYLRSKISYILDNVQSPTNGNARNFRQLMEKGSDLKRILILLLEAMVMSSTINLRSLMKTFDSEYRPKEYKIDFPSRRIENCEIPLVLVFDFLLKLLNSYQALILRLEKTNIDAYLNPKVYGQNNLFELLMSQLVLIIDHENHKFNEGQKQFQFDNKRVSYIFQSFGADYNVTLSNANVMHELNLSAKKLLLKAIKTLDSLG